MRFDLLLREIRRQRKRRFEAGAVEGVLDLYDELIEYAEKQCKTKNGTTEDTEEHSPESFRGCALCGSPSPERKETMNPKTPGRAVAQQRARITRKLERLLKRYDLPSVTDADIKQVLGEVIAWIKASAARAAKRPGGFGRSI